MRRISLLIIFRRRTPTAHRLIVAGFELLDLLSRDPGISAAWAAARIGVSAQSTGTVLLRLSDAGLITREITSRHGRPTAIGADSSCARERSCDSGAVPV